MAAFHEVPVASLSLERFEPLLANRWKDVDEAFHEARRLLKGRVVWHVNSTARGGGVAELLQSLLAYARGAGVDVRWMTISGNPEFFRVTKRIHNRLHDSAGDGGPLGPEEREVYEAALAVPRVVSADVKVIWRCHVGVDRPGELARETWDFLRRYIEDADAYVFSREQFVWSGLDRERIWIVPPSIDAFSPKNQDLDPEAVRSILAVIGAGPADHHTKARFRRFDGTEARVTRPADLVQDGPVPEDAPLVSQVSRWDRLKDPVGVQRCFAEYVESDSAHLLLAGPSVAGVSDDPEGAEVLEEVKAHREDLPEEKRARVHLASLPTDDTEENAAMVNAIQRRSNVMLQKSLAEGFGLTVAEAMWKARPVVASRVGGIQDQIEDGVSGVLIDDPTDLQAVARAIDAFIEDPARAAEVGEAARQRVLENFLGTRSLVQYMDLIETLLASDGS
jgi:trehalose synthase